MNSELEALGVKMVSWGTSNSFGKKKKSKKDKFLTPDMYTIATSTIPNAGNGAFANIYLPKGTTLGKYKGKRLNKDGSNYLGEYEEDQPSGKGRY